jgi:Tol biopolymer transport system component
LRRQHVLAACLLFGCASPAVDFAALPEAPIAFVHRTLEETERMVDELQAQEKAVTPGPEDEFDIHIEGLQKLTGRRTQADATRDHQGRVVLYVAREGRMEKVEALPRGARPLDWSKDHGRLMFSAAQRGLIHLFEWVAATGEVRQLTSGPNSQIDGCYGPEAAIAWVELASAPKAGARIWVRRPGEAARELTEGPSDAQPAWSPDGSRLVFTRVERGVPSLHWIDPESGAGGGYGRGRSAVFSPDGEWIVYSGLTAQGWRLRRMRFDGAGKRSLGTSGFEENEPAISPDGRYVVFAATKDQRTPVSRLLVRSFDGLADRQLEITGSALLPVW